MEMFSIGLMIVMVVLASAYAKVIMHRAGVAPHKPRGKAVAASEPDHAAQQIVELEKLRIQERKEARALVERLIQAKLDTINNAVAMGASDKELERLDARLEKIVGGDKLKALLEGKDLDSHDADLRDTDLNAEIERLRQVRQ
jgi:hypothetical protein